MVDENMDFRGASALAPGTAYIWTGTLTVPAEGDYTFMLQAAVGDGANGNGGMTLDGRKVFTARGGVVHRDSAALTKARTAPSSRSGRACCRRQMVVTIHV